MLSFRLFLHKVLLFFSIYILYLLTKSIFCSIYCGNQNRELFNGSKENIGDTVLLHLLSNLFHWFHAQITLHKILLTTQNTELNKSLSNPRWCCVHPCRYIVAEVKKVESACEARTEQTKIKKTLLENTISKQKKKSKEKEKNVYCSCSREAKNSHLEFKLKIYEINKHGNIPIEIEENKQTKVNGSSINNSWFLLKSSTGFFLFSSLLAAASRSMTEWIGNKKKQIGYVSAS